MLNKFSFLYIFTLLLCSIECRLLLVRLRFFDKYLDNHNETSSTYVGYGSLQNYFQKDKNQIEYKNAYRSLLSSAALNANDLENEVFARRRKKSSAKVSARKIHGSKLRLNKRSILINLPLFFISKLVTQFITMIFI